MNVSANGFLGGRGFWMQKQSVRYLLATALSAAISFCLPIALHELARISEDISVAISLGVVFIVNFITVRVFVFRSKAPAAIQLLLFAASSILFRIAEYLMFLTLFRLFEQHYIVALMIALSASFAAKFFFQRAFVFRT
jgi:putative flippase GtrA